MLVIVRALELTDMQKNRINWLIKDEIGHIDPPSLPIKYLWEFLSDGRTPARALTDDAMAKLLPILYGAEKIIELGAAGDYYKCFVPDSQCYVTSNFSPGCDMILDMTRLDLPDNSVDAFVSVFALEHLFDYQAAIKEQYRVLRPGGRLLIVVPFLYYYHAAPDDFFRMTASAMEMILKPFHILFRQPLGGRWLIFAEFLHEKEVMGSQLGFYARLALRVLALPFLFKSLKQNDTKYAFAYAYLCEKKIPQ